MALRVLLADESSTIKKVFQLALQDFAVDVRPVNIGTDVVQVAQSFQPDIIFADVLLQKKNGYEVSAEVKADTTLFGVPVVLMWSGFMELDEDKFQASHANAKLEKPFDVTTLRKLVTDLVPKTQNQRISQFLAFPKMPDLQESSPPKALAHEEDFKQMPMPKSTKAPAASAKAPAAKLGADRFRIPVQEEAEMPVSLQLSNDPIDVETIFREVDEPEEFQMRSTRHASAPFPPLSSKAPPPPEAKAPPVAKISEADIERIVRAQAQEMIEAVIWKVVPELAQQIIEREIQRLLKEKDAALY
jgi:CheY-like chemotaxis protein